MQYKGLHKISMQYNGLQWISEHQELFLILNNKNNFSFKKAFYINIININVFITTLLKNVKMYATSLIFRISTSQ